MMPNEGSGGETDVEGCFCDLCDRVFFGLTDLAPNLQVHATPNE